MAAFTYCSFSGATPSLSNTTLKPHKPINSLWCRPSSSSNSHPTLFLNRQKSKLASRKLSCRLVTVAGLVDGNSETYPEAESTASNAAATINTKLPRRSLLVQFTCDECGERTQRLINQLAYERGLVYVQCAGCERYHKLADNLGLIIEYDFREELTAESNTDQVC